MTEYADEIYELKPRRHPERGPVFRLMFDYIACDDTGGKLAEVFIHPRRYPKQLNPYWRVEVDIIGANPYSLDANYIYEQSVIAVFERLTAWLERVAPDASPMTITWHELVRLTLGRATKSPTPYKTRQELQKQRERTYSPKYRYRDLTPRRGPKSRPSLSVDIDYL